MKKKLMVMAISLLLILSSNISLFANEVTDSENLNSTEFGENIPNETIPVEQDEQQDVNDNRDNTNVVDELPKEELSQGITPAVETLGKQPMAVGDTIATTFPDPNLAQVVASAVSGGNVNAILTQPMVDNCIFLNGNGANIGDLTGIETLTSLEVLYLNDNQLTTLPASIGNLNSLRALSLSNNQLTSLPDSIGNLTNLTQLFLSDNQLTSLSTNIGNLTNLDVLDLDNNQLTSLPTSIGDLTALQGLFLNSNKLTILPDSIVNLTNLTRLILYNNKLTSLPTNTGNLVNLETLELSSNQLTNLPDSLGNSTNLQQLYINNNKLTSLPISIGDLSTLEVLDAANNQLISLPDSIGNLTSLTWLGLYNNQLTRLPDSIGGLTNLVQFYLNNNQLTGLPTSIRNLTSLYWLGLSKNHLESLPENIGDLTSLAVLELDDNLLTYLPENIGGLSSLEVLYLNNNKLLSLPENIGNLSNLNWLDLSDNQLVSLPDGIGNLTMLNQLYIPNNQLTSLPNSIGGLTNLIEFYLDNNLLPSNYSSTLIAMGLPANGSLQDQLIISNLPTPYIIKSQTDLDAIDLRSILGLQSNRALSPNHQYILENYLDENNQPVSIADYIQNGSIIKEGSITAQVRAIGTGLFSNNSDHALTSERITLKLTNNTALFNLRFDLNGGNGTTPETQSLEEGQVSTPVADPIREGYTFTGWNTSADGSGMTWVQGTTPMPGNDVVLFAQWKGNNDSGDKGNKSKNGLPKTGGNTVLIISLLTLGSGIIISSRKYKNK